jgi:hypothetical protein
MLAGSPQSLWDTDHGDDPDIQGYAVGFSVNHGQSITFKINTPLNAGETTVPYHLQIFRLGYYGGMGARLVDTILNLKNTAQPAPVTDLNTGLVDAGTWHASYTWQVPASATSGIYFAKATRDDGNLGTDSKPASNHVRFVVRDDEGHSDILFKTSDATWQAYNPWGGASLYSKDSSIFPDPYLPHGQGYKVSYNRPFNTLRNWQGQVYYTEYPMVRWLESNGYDVSYYSDLDNQRGTGRITDHKIWLGVGHDEYWSQAQRRRVEAARAAGVNLAFLDGNESYWETAYDPGIGGSASDPRTMVCYKETNFPELVDPSRPEGWTGLWRDDQYPSIHQPDPENALTGNVYGNNGLIAQPLDLRVPPEVAHDRFWRNTSIANLKSGDPPATIQGIIGHEWDEVQDNGFQPPGLVSLSHTVYKGGVHSLTLYRDSTGKGMVFGAGSICFDWALDDHHDTFDTDDPQFIHYIAPVDQRIRQAMVNLFADMGNVQPATLQSGLVRATQSTDHTAPVSSITAPPAGAHFQPGHPITITGTASDSGGGVVGGVEVSIDGGATWHPATGLNSWSYTFTPSDTGMLTLLSRAVDDSGNLETPLPGGRPIEVLDGTTNKLTASSQSTVYGKAVTFTATITSSGSPVTTGNVVFKDGNTTLATVALDGSGQAVFTTTKLSAKTHTITATFTGNAVDDTSSASISHTVTKAPLVIRAVNKTRVAGDPTTTLTATYTGLVNGDTSAVVKGLKLASPGASSNVAGTYKITPSGATATNYTISYVTGTLTVNPGVAKTFVFTPPSNPRVGVAFDLKVTARDAYGNIATGYRGTLNLTSNDPLAPSLGHHTFTASDKGVFTFHVTLRTRGKIRLTVKDPASGITDFIDVTVG